MYKLSRRSHQFLRGVHPDLVRVVKRAITLTKTDFGVICGVRDYATQEQLVEDGFSNTMNSKHLIQCDGYSHAVDLSAYDNEGKYTEDLEWYRLIMQAMFTASIIEGVPIKAGGLWRTFVDAYHFELDRHHWPLK